VASPPLSSSDAPVTLQLVRDPRRWEECRAAFAGATVFHRWEWCRFAATGLGMSFVPVGVVVESRLVGLAPVLLRRRGPIATANWVPFPYLGPLLRSAHTPHALASLRRELRRRRVVVTQLSFSPDAETPATLLAGAGFETGTDRTMVVPLVGRDESDVWQGMTGNVRRSIQRGRRLGLRVRKAGIDEIVEILPPLLAGAYGRQGGASTYSRATMRRFWDEFRHRCDVRMAALVGDGEVLAVSVWLTDRATAYLWLMAGRRPPGLDASGPLYWDGFTWAHRRGCMSVDLLGTPTPGIAAYKRRLGAIPRDHLVARRFAPRLAARGLELEGGMRRALGHAVTQRFSDRS
jgi:hypothetical protein